MILCLILVRLWFCSQRAEDAAFHQVELQKDLLIYKTKKHDNKGLAAKLLERMSSHLWYTSPEFVVFSLASTLVTNEEKKKMALAILRQPKGQLKRGKVSMRPLESTESLADRVGDQSLHFFDAWGVGTDFLSKPVEEWHGIPAYQKFVTLVKSVPLTNDATERIVKRSSDYKNIGSKSDLDFQATLQAVERAIENVPSRKTKKALLKSYS